MFNGGNGGFVGAVVGLKGARSALSMIGSRVNAPACACSLTELLMSVVRARGCNCCRTAGRNKCVD